MKSIIGLTFIFALVCYAQAYNTYLEVTVGYEGFDVFKGQIVGQMKGNSQSHQFVLKPNFFSRRETLKYMFNFPEYLKSVELTWETKSSKIIDIKPLVVSWPSFGQGLVNHVYLSDKKQLKNGETAIFTQA